MFSKGMKGSGDDFQGNLSEFIYEFLFNCLNFSMATPFYILRECFGGNRPEESFSGEGIF